jgi:hypothetical protein
LATSSVDALSAFEDLRLRIGRVVERAEELQVCLADVGPHPYVRLGDA